MNHGFIVDDSRAVNTPSEYNSQIKKHIMLERRCSFSGRLTEAQAFQKSMDVFLENRQHQVAKHEQNFIEYIQSRIWNKCMIQLQEHVSRIKKEQARVSAERARVSAEIDKVSLLTTILSSIEQNTKLLKEHLSERDEIDHEAIERLILRIKDLHAEFAELKNQP